MAKFEEIDMARRLLGLEEFASMKDLKKAYRQKAHLYHPDISCQEISQNEEIMKILNRSYQLLLEYLSRYQYSFKEDDVDRAYPDDAYLKKWGFGWFEGV